MYPLTNPRASNFACMLSSLIGAFFILGGPTKAATTFYSPITTLSVQNESEKEILRQANDKLSKSLKSESLDIDCDLRNFVDKSAANAVQDHEIRVEFLNSFIAALISTAKSRLSLTIEDASFNASAVIPLGAVDLTFYECKFKDNVQLSGGLDAAKDNYELILSRCDFSKSLMINNLSLGKLKLDACVFSRSIVFETYNHIGKITIDKCAIKENLQIANLTVDKILEAARTTIDGDLIVNGLSFAPPTPGVKSSHDSLLAVSEISVGHQTTFNQIQLPYLNFIAGTSFGFLTMQFPLDCDIDAACQNRTFSLNNITFKTFNRQNLSVLPLINDETDWHKLRTLLKHSVFNPQNYDALSTYYVFLGRQDIADEVYQAKKTMEAHYEKNVVSTIINFLFWIFSIYGKNPFVTFLWCLAFVLAGGFVFRKRYMCERDTFTPATSSTRYYNSFLCSFNAFVPTIEFFPGARWIPQENLKFVQIYMAFHIFMGLILVPLLIACSAGLFK